MKYLLQILMKLGLSNYLASQLSNPSGVFGSRFIGRMMNKSNAQLDLLSLKCAEVKPTEHIVEIGFGNGKLLQQLCETISDGKVYGADISKDLITQVDKRLKIYVENNKLELHLSGVSQLPLPNNSIDTIITNNTIYFWPDPLTDAKELLRILKPNGKLILGYRTSNDMKNYPFVTQNPDIFKNHYTDKEIEHLFLEVGFSSINIEVRKGELAESHVAVIVK